MSNLRKYLLYIVGGLFIIICSLIGSQLSKSMFGSYDRDNINALIGKQLKEFKAKLPMQIGEETLLYDVSNEKKTIVFKYKLAKRINNETSRNLIFVDIRERVKENICKDKEFLNVTKAGLRYEMRYVDMNNHPINSLFFDYRDCE